MHDSSPATTVAELRAEPYNSPAATAMIEAANRANEALYGHADQSPLSPDEFSPQHRGHFVVAYLDGVPIGCGGFRRHREDPTGATAEVKRMYVEPHVRRRGIARHVLTRLETDAQTAGYHAVILDTGSKQSDAHALYEACNYHRTAGFGIYKDKPGNRAYLKTLPHPSERISRTGP
ncbi:GNAT family N-acetyltransferase [Nocardia sp. CA-107356]|uniref:GNAT family N-acetyltransferase n=1 Tax=Nocardia sp. CA-107356 TaxID=3239972 RepID=UPI003D8A715E